MFPSSKYITQHTNKKNDLILMMMRWVGGGKANRKKREIEREQASRQAERDGHTKQRAKRKETSA